MHFRRLWLILGTIYIGLILTGSLLRAPEIELPFPFADKIIHFLMYFILVGWFVQLYHRRASQWGILCFAILFGLGIEYLQGLTNYRSFELLDAAANAIGASTAFLLTGTHFEHLLVQMDQRIYQYIKAS
jgi:VanZ family protein